MAVAHLTPTDRRTRDAVLQQLEWDPAVDASAVGVTAHDGVVTLTGFIDTLAGKLAAERAVKSVRGVKAVANDLAVRALLERTDADIATDALRALELRGTVPDAVQVAVHNAHITLTGSVRSLFQKSEAEAAARRVKGARGIHNHIDVMAGAITQDVRTRIVKALHRNAELDAKGISVTVDGNVVRLVGIVTTWPQRDAAERAAADAPGITSVDNQIVVQPRVEAIDEQC